MIVYVMLVVNKLIANTLHHYVVHFYILYASDSVDYSNALKFSIIVQSK